ncbi:putative cytochrome c oxidase assembly protein (SCO2) [Candidatus Nasuia deltocephalinicola]|nr:putative cytochrome c oxidase assembly protein (SCO2) [Candidatus Nasuia deltocephalinicola]
MIKKLLLIFFTIYIIKKYKKKNKNFINIKGQIKNINLKFNINNKKKTKNEIFKKNKILFFFGYTLCSNICPKILENITNKIKILKNFYKLKFIFLSINWKYENSELVQKFLNKLKTKNLLGFCETGKNTEKISNKFRVIYKNKKNKIIHSNLIYIINKYCKPIFIEINKKKKNFIKNI